MKSIPGNLPDSAYYAMLKKEIRKASIRPNECLLGLNSCPKAINSHSIPESLLNCLAQNGHVLGFPELNFRDQQKIWEGGLWRPSPIGIGKASTFRGFCKAHDNKFFEAIERRDVTPTVRQSFLFHFRAACHALYQNISFEHVTNLMLTARTADNHNPYAVREEIARLREHQRSSFDNQRRKVDAMKSSLLQDVVPVFDCLCVRVDCVPDILCSSLFVPVADLNGKFLLSFLSDDALDACQEMAITISKDSIGGFILISWRSEDLLPRLFVESFVEHECNLDELVQLVFRSTSNFFFSERWWKSLPNGTRDHLCRLATEKLVPFSKRNFDEVSKQLRNNLSLVDSTIVSVKKYLS